MYINCICMRNQNRKNSSSTRNNNQNNENDIHLTLYKRILVEKYHKQHILMWKMSKIECRVDNNEYMHVIPENLYRDISKKKLKNSPCIWLSLAFKRCCCDWHNIHAFQIKIKIWRPFHLNLNSPLIFCGFFHSVFLSTERKGRIVVIFFITLWAHFICSDDDKISSRASKKKTLTAKGL